MEQFWASIQFVIDHKGALAALGWGISEVLGVFGLGGVIPVAYQAVIKQAAQDQLASETEKPTEKK